MLKEVVEGALARKTIITIEIIPSSIANHKHNPKVELPLLAECVPCF
jgi:hypothetical protein